MSGHNQKRARKPATTADEKIAYKKKLHEIEATIRGGDNGRCGGSGLIRVACRILDFCKSEDSLRLGYGFASVKTIAEEERLSERQVKRHVARIQRNASYFVIEPGGRHVANHYWPSVGGVPIHPAWTPERAAKLESQKEKHRWRREMQAEKLRERRSLRQIFAHCGIGPTDLVGYAAMKKAAPIAVESFEGRVRDAADANGDIFAQIDRASIEREWRAKVERLALGGNATAQAVLVEIDAADLATILS